METREATLVKLTSCSREKFIPLYTHGKKLSNPNILSLKTRYNTANRKATLKYIKSSLLYKSLTLSQYIQNRKMVQSFEIQCHNAEERCAPFLVKTGHV